MSELKIDKFAQIMQVYYSIEPIRLFVKFLTFICEISLAIYLMLLPIQLAYHSLIKVDPYYEIQEYLDIAISITFSIHLFLYFDNGIEKIIKRPNSFPKYTIKYFGKWTRLITI
jgi:hypothetical protein